jgi:hypothetical protein
MLDAGFWMLDGGESAELFRGRQQRGEDDDGGLRMEGGGRGSLTADERRWTQIKKHAERSRIFANEDGLVESEANKVRRRDGKG